MKRAARRLTQTAYNGMAGGVTFQIDTTGFRRMAQELSNFSGTPIQQVVLSRAGHIMETCVRYTPVRSAGQIETSVKFRNRNLWENSQAPRLRGDPIISTNKAGLIGFWDPSNLQPGQKSNLGGGKQIHGKSFHIMNDKYRFSDARWARFQAAAADLANKQIDLAAAKQSRGIMAHSWYQIARALGVDIDVPDYVKNARPVSGAEFQNGFAQKFSSADGFYVELTNTNPILINRLDGAGILSRAVQAAINGFTIDLEKGVFDDLKRRAQRYPGIFVS